MKTVMVTVAAAICYCLVSFLPSPANAYEAEINGLSATVGGKIASSGKKLIAVTDFVDLQGSVTELGRFLAEEFSTALASQGKGFEVVDRANLKMILTEHKLSATGIIDPATARKLGQVAGVQALITGTITPFGDSVRLSVKVLDTETAKVISAANVNIARTKAIEELLARGIQSAPVSSGQQSAAGGYSQPTPSSPSASSPNSKKVGDVLITVKRITVAQDGKVTVILDFMNQAEKDTGLSGLSGENEILTDDKGNSFVFESGLGSYDWVHLNARASNDIILKFRPNDNRVKSKDIGDIFSMSLRFRTGDSRAEVKSSVSFMDIKAQKSK